MNIKNKLLLGVTVFSISTGAFGMNESDEEYFFSPPAEEAKYLHVTVRNCSHHNDFIIDGVNMSGGRKEAVPDNGTKIPPRKTAGFVFKQNDALFSNYGPEANITISGKAGDFYLYVQQNYCLLKSGAITAKYSYNAHYKDVEGGVLIDAEMIASGKPLEIKSGAYGASYGRVAFSLAERRKSSSGKAPEEWKF